MNEEVKHWAQKTLDRNLGPMKGSSIFLALSPEKMKDDPTPIFQFGLALLLDKPIIILVPEGEPVPKNVQKVALEIVTFKNGDWNEGQRKLKEALIRHGLGEFNAGNSQKEEI